MRTFIQYDGEGEVIAVVQTESLPEGLEHPFYLEDETHGVLELGEGEEAARRPGGELGQDFRVDVAKRKLVGKPAPGRAAGEATRQKEAATRAPETKAAPAAGAAKTSAKKAATKKGKRSSGSK